VDGPAVAQSCMEVLRSRMGEPRTPGVSGFGLIADGVPVDGHARHARFLELTRGPHGDDPFPQEPGAALPLCGLAVASGCFGLTGRDGLQQHLQGLIQKCRQLLSS
jgi:hypothetical protein